MKSRPPIYPSKVSIQNPEVIGHTFKGYDGHLYLCESWQVDKGFTMARLRTIEGARDFVKTGIRLSASEHALGKAFHPVTKDLSLLKLSIY